MIVVIAFAANTTFRPSWYYGVLVLTFRLHHQTLKITHGLSICGGRTPSELPNPSAAAESVSEPGSCNIYSVADNRPRTHGINAFAGFASGAPPPAHA
ncbi:hypothetical protein EVAR_102145_1 [Eumeta japonica]|uniref:Uncharacterized protein n=1 Tax=Eumeta variegata TaxID=151549 RepID=A0A4C1U031_EUMVA|nr:hypothetical protein EVAR_102145_1 [Eumeta japonica]